MESSKRRGFTTIEMIAVMVVFGITAALAGPRFYQLVTAVSTRTAADRLARAAELARANAVRFGRDAELRIDQTGMRFWVQVDTTVNVSGVKDTIGSIQDLSNSKVTMALTVAGATKTSAIVCFDVRGVRSTRSPCDVGIASILFSQSTHSDSVQVTSLGKVVR